MLHPLTTQQYNIHFTSTRPASYKIYYSNSDGNVVDTNIFASSWSKTIYTDSTRWTNKNNGLAVFDLNNIQSVSPTITGTINLFINNKLCNTENVTVLNAGGHFEIGAIVLKQP